VYSPIVQEMLDRLISERDQITCGEFCLTGIYITEFCNMLLCARYWLVKCLLASGDSEAVVVNKLLMCTFAPNPVTKPMLSTVGKASTRELEWWLGLYDGEGSGKPEWLDGSVISYFPFAPDEPKRDMPGSCAYFQTAGKKLTYTLPFHTVPCHTVQSPVILYIFYKILYCTKLVCFRTDLTIPYRYALWSQLLFGYLVSK